jgi:hypothetical protein
VLKIFRRLADKLPCQRPTKSSQAPNSDGASEAGTLSPQPSWTTRCFMAFLSLDLDVLTSAFTFPSPEPVQNPIRTMRLLERNNAGEISLTKYLVGDNIP